MCNQCICEPKCSGDVTNVHAQKHFHVVPWTREGGCACPGGAGAACVKSQLVETNTGHVRAHDLETLFFQANEEKQWT